MGNISIPKEVIWDWNGTLVDDTWLACEVINEIREDAKLQPISMEFFREIYQHPIIKMYQAMGFEVDADKFSELSHRWGARYLERFSETKLHLGAESVLSSLQRSGLSQHVLSAHNHNYLIENIKEHSIGHYFQEILGLDNRTADSKVDNGHRLLAQIKSSAEEVLLIGDSSHDFEVAKELGCHCLLVAHGAESKQRLERHGVVVVSSFAELQDYLTL